MPVAAGLIAAIALATVAGVAAPLALLVAWLRRRRHRPPGGKRKASDEPLTGVVSAESAGGGATARATKAKPAPLVMVEQRQRLHAAAPDADSSATYGSTEAGVSEPVTPRGTRAPPLDKVHKEDTAGSAGSAPSSEWDSFDNGGAGGGSRPGTPSTPSATGGGGATGSLRRKTRMTKQTSVTTYKRSARGNVKVGRVDPSGRYVTVTNAGAATEYLGKWTVQRKVEGSDDAKTFQFPADFSLPPGAEVKVCSAGYHDYDASADFQLPQGNWGAGPQARTELLAATGKVMAALKQCTDVKREMNVDGENVL